MQDEEKNNVKQDLAFTASTQLPSQAVALSPAAGPTMAGTNPVDSPPLPSKPAHRTVGLKIFDVFLYPFLTNFVVFGISVGATYLTNKGAMRNAKGNLIYGKTGEWFAKRGDWLVEKFKSAGMTHEQADMSKMVFFSFADGTAVAPLVKLLEDRREKISKWTDDRLGTTPEDEVAAYKAEPKQSWFSVVMGRLAAVSIVVPTAVFLDKAGLNRVLFSEPGKKIGAFIASKPGIARHFRHMDMAELGRVGAFELFYTSVCTGGLYYASRALARLTSRKKTGEMASILDQNGKDLSTEILRSVTPALPYAAPQAEKHSGPDTLVTAISAMPSQKPAAQGIRKDKPADQPVAHFVDMVQHTPVMERM